MKLQYASMLAFCITPAHADLLTTKEINSAEPPDGVSWQIEKEWEIGKQTTFKALFDFTKKGNGGLHLGGGLWVAVLDGHQDTAVYSGDLLKMELKDLDNDGFLDLKIDGSILFFDEKGEKAIHTEPVSGEFIYMPAEGVFKPRSLQMLTLYTMAEPVPDQFSGPRAATESLYKALANHKYEEYRMSLHPATREVGEYGSREGMKFWGDEFRDLMKMGFDGVFQFEEVQAASATPREPAGSVKAYPVVGGKRIDEYCLLMKTEGEWKIVRMF